MSTDKPFEEPRHIVLNRIYTRGGDEGKTSLVGGQRVDKSHPLIQAYGTVDELNAWLGLIRTSVRELDPKQEWTGFLAILARVQHELFNLGSILATRPADVHPRQPRITAKEIEQLEAEMDTMNAVLPVLHSFVLPGGSRVEAELHVARTICRRAERILVEAKQSEPLPEHALEYLNRLSDALFVWSRWANHVLQQPEVLWSPNVAASGHS